MTIPYRAGDVVVHKTSNVEHIIFEVNFNEYPLLNYSTNRGAWYYHDDFVLKQEATEETIRKLAASLNEEFDESDTESDVESDEDI